MRDGASHPGSAGINVFLPEIEEVESSLDSITGSRTTFPSFCCNPSAIRALACGIGRSRRGEAIRGVGPLNSARSKMCFFVNGTETVAKPAEPAPSVLRTLAVSVFFAGSHTGPRGHSVGLDEI